MDYIFTGKLAMKGNEESIGAKGFKKREFVLTDSGKYPQSVLFQLTGKNCPLLDSVQLGTEITVHFSLRGREWINPQGVKKFFNSLECWKIDGVRSEQNDSLTPTPDSDLPF